MEKDLLEKKSKGPLLLSNAYGKVRSRYLNSPTSSCHDLCKYGHKHECDDERNHAVFKRFMTNNTTSDAVQNHARGLNVSDGRKSSGLKLKASDKAKALEQNIRQEEKEDGRKSSEDHAMAPHSLFLEKKRIQFPQKTILQDSFVEVNQKRSLISNKKKNKKKQDTMKPNAASPVPERSPPDMLKASIEISSADGPNILEMKVASYMRETATSSASKEDRQKKLPVGKLSGSSKSQSVEKNASVVARKIDGSAKRSISLKARSPLLRSVAQWNGVGNLQGSTNIRKITKEKSKNEGMIIKDKNFSKESDGDSSESCVSELSEIEDVKMKQSCELSTTTTTTTSSCELSGGKRRVRRTAAVKLHDTSSLPYKMKFQRGTVIDPRPTENIGLKRLKFRRGRELNKNSNGEITKRIIRRKDKGDLKVPSSAAHANSSEATAVILKHQDAQEKRNLRALFNHVIEETANKLVQTRKSKVKALVGAFETVISLQETKAAHLV